MSIFDHLRARYKHTSYRCADASQNFLVKKRNKKKRKSVKKGEEENSRSFVIWSAILGAPSVCCIHVGLDVQ